MTTNYARGLYKEYELLLTKNEALEAEQKVLLSERNMLEKRIKKQEKLLIEIAEQNNEIEALKKEILRLNGLLGTDGKNSGLPTSKTPIGKKKVIPNSRIKSGKTKGGQPGHAKRKLEAFEEAEIMEVKNHEQQVCPRCGSQEIIESEEPVQKDELDYEVVVIKRRHNYPQYHCASCGHDFHAPIPNHLKEENQYGSRVPALALALMDMGNVSVNKVKRMIYGLSEEEINPSEGYIIKQQKIAAKALTGFQEELRKECQQKDVLYWDDTVIAINKKRGCLRFYGDERIALYTAHLSKNKEGIDEDGILKQLPVETVVMHDHNCVNYNAEYSFSNAECNVHLIRDLQKTVEHLQHNWAVELAELLKRTNAERNTVIEKGAKAFDDGYIKSFFEEFDEIMLKAVEENRADYNKCYGKDERTLIQRIFKYKDNYLCWVVNFELPFSNNVSERALRGVKSKMKISSQFHTEEAAKDYATIRSYIETCFRNGVDEIQALMKLCEGSPYSLAELLTPKSDI